MSRHPARTASWAALLALAATTAVLGRRPAAWSDPAEVTWRSDFEEARAEARRTGAPLFVVFR